MLHGVRRMTRALLVLTLLLGLAGCGPRETWRQKLTLVVETPSGLVSGSAVVEVTGDMNQLPGSQSEIHYSYTGEATMVEVSPGRYLFALLGGSEERFYWAARDRFENLRRREWLRRIPRQREPVELLPDHLPLLVTFGDITDPMSVMRVDPDDLDGAFGCGEASDLALAPWRAARKTYAQWVEDETWRRAIQGASERAGLTGAVAEALEEAHRILKPDRRPFVTERERLAVLSQHFTDEQNQQWLAAHAALLAEIPATLPSPERLAQAYGGQCYRLISVTLEITEEPVTEGVVEGVLGWLGQALYIIPPEQQPRFNPSPEQRLMPSDFIDWRTLKAIREGTR